MFRIIAVLAAACVAAMFAPQLMQHVVANAPIDDATSEQPVRQGARRDVNTPVPTGGTMILKAASNGHFYTETRINGRPIDVMVDTGASVVALTYEDARKIGVRPAPSDFTIPVRTANGTAHAAPVTLREVRIGSIRVANVEGLVSQRGNLGITLLGMSFLGRLSRADIRAGELILKP